MSHLTLEKMDKINFLITEVSLECLGNKFFDIYGNQANSLLKLISASSLRAESTNCDEETALWKALTAEKVKPTITKTFKQPIVVPERKRRASFSNADNEQESSNDPESLLVPLAPKAAKIARRRSTISVQLANKGGRRPMAISSTQPFLVHKQQTFDAPPRHSGSVTDIMRNLKRDIDARKFRKFHILLTIVNKMVNTTLSLKIGSFLGDSFRF